MKKLNVLICVLLMLLSLTACKGDKIIAEDTTTSVPDTVLTTTAEAMAAPSSTTLMTTTEIITESTYNVTSAAEFTTIYSTAELTTGEVTTTEATTEAETTEVTSATPTTTNIVVSEPQNYCTVRIECSTIYDNFDKFKDNKKSFLTSDGVILDNVKVELSGGESAFDVIKKACEENICTDNCKYCKDSGVQIEYTYTPAFNNYYIEGIHQIYEKDCGTQSGWMYSVNGAFPDVGSSSYTVSNGDTIVLSYTCNMGEDIGNSY